MGDAAQVGAAHEVGSMDISEAKRRYESGPRMLLARRVVLLILTLVSTVIMARLVSPYQYGLASMSVVILAFAYVVRDLGVTNAVLRKPRIDQAELSMIFWFNACTTTLVSALLVLLAPLAADFYDESVVGPVIVVSVLGFFVGGFALQHRALINRDLRFSTVAVIDIAGALAGFVVMLVLGVIRHDVWAIVIGSLVQALTQAVLAIALSRWRPSRPRRTEGLGDVVRFGANSTVYATSVFLSGNISIVLVGHAFGSAALGQFTRGQALFRIPNLNLIQPVVAATMPLLTRLREDATEYRSAYLRLVRQLSVFLMPASVTLACAALPLTQALLGERWRSAGLVLTALAPALAIMGIAFAINDVFVTQNRTAELRNLGLIELVIRIGALFLGLQFGLVQTALAFTLSTVLVALLRVVVVGRKGPVTARDQFQAFGVGLVPAVGAGAACSLVFVVGQPSLHAVAAATMILAGVAGTVLALLVARPSRAAMLDLVELIFGRRLLRFAARLRHPNVTR